jgi:hypothetical protein
MSAQNVSATVAVAALGLGLINLWYGVVRPWWKSRRAEPDARLELVAYQTAKGWQQDERIVVTNHGPSKMARLVIRVRDDSGTDYTDDVSDLWPCQPIVLLYPAQTLHLKLERALSHRRPGSVVLRWRDGRRAEQQREVFLSYHRVA